MVGYLFAYNWILQQYDDTKHISLLSQIDRKVKVLDWPSQRTKLYPKRKFVYKERLPEHDGILLHNNYIYNYSWSVGTFNSINVTLQ